VHADEQQRCIVCIDVGSRMPRKRPKSINASRGNESPLDVRPRHFTGKVWSRQIESHGACVIGVDCQVGEAVTSGESSFRSSWCSRGSGFAL